MTFKVGDVVLYDKDPCEMTSWRDEKGNLVAGPPGCPVTVEAVNEDGTLDIAWFYPGDYTLNRKTFPSRVFIKV